MSGHLTLQIDPRSHSAYIYLRSIRAGGVARTEKLGDGVLADFGEGGELLGVELLGPKAVERLFSLASHEARLEPLHELSPKKEMIERLIA